MNNVRLWSKVLLLTALFSSSLSCIKSFLTTASSAIDTTGMQIIRVDSSWVGPELFLRYYYRQK